jgi:hypothetical protein
MRGLVVIAVVVIGSLAVTACASPKYKYRPVKLVESPSTPFPQARAICASRAQVAAQQASAGAPKAARPDRSYDCTSSGTYGNVSSHCDPAASNGIAEGFNQAADAINADAAGRSAAGAVMRGCMAEYGWTLERRCVENCK